MTQGVNFFTNPNAPSSNAMRLLAMQNAMPVRAASESIEDYNKRMAQWKDELKAKQKAENSEILQGLIAGVDTKISTDIHSLKNTNSAIEKLKFWQYVLEGYDTNLDSQISALKAKQGLIQQQIEKIKRQGEQKEKLDIRDGLGLRSAAEKETLLSSLAAPKTGMFDNDELKTGSRNILG